LDRVKSAKEKKPITSLLGKSNQGKGGKRVGASHSGKEVNIIGKGEQ